MAYEAEKRVITSHQQLVSAVRQRVQRFARTSWRGLGSWRDEDVDRFVRAIVPIVQGGQRTVGQLTNTYLDALARIAGLAPVPPADPVLDARGVPASVVYRRPATTMYTALSEGKPLGEAFTLSLYRLDDLIAMDMQLTHTRTADARGGFTYYRRTLKGSENCALCALASTQRYRRGNLMPIHPGCDCTVTPVEAKRDPGQVINEERLESINRVLEEQGLKSHGGTEGRYRDATDIIVREHGEFGPTLSWRGQQFTGPDAIRP